MAQLKIFGKKKFNFGKAITVVAFFSFFSKIIGMIRQVVLTNYYGASAVSDAYVLASSIPHTLYNLVAMAVGVAFTPIFHRTIARDGEREADIFTNKIIGLLCIISTFFAFVLLVCTKTVVDIFAGGAPQETINLTVKFLRISAFTLYFIGLNGVFSSYLKAKSRFTSIAIIGIPLSVVEIISIILSSRFEISILAYGIVGAALAQSVILYINAKNTGFKIRPNFKILNDDNIKQIFIMSIPIFLGVCIDEVNVIIDKRIAASFNSGSISLLSYANTLVAIVHTVITVSVNTVMFPKISQDVALQNKSCIKQTLMDGLVKSLILIIPATFGIIIFSKQIIQLVYMRGEFTLDDVRLMAVVMAMYSIGLIANAVRTIVQSYYYANKKTKTTMYASFIGIFFNIILNFMLSKIIGISGLALASSISIVITSIILIVFLPKNINVFIDKTFIKKIWVFLLSACVMSVVGLLIYNLCMKLELSNNLTVIPIMIVCVAVYFVTVICFKGIDKHDVISIIKRKR